MAFYSPLFVQLYQLPSEISVWSLNKEYLRVMDQKDTVLLLLLPLFQVLLVAAQEKDSKFNSTCGTLSGVFLRSSCLIFHLSL